MVQIAVTDPPDGDSPECNALTDGIALTEGTNAVIPPEAWDIDGRPPGCSEGECCTGKSGEGVDPNGHGLCPLVFQTIAEVNTSLTHAVQLLIAHGPLAISRELQGFTTDIYGVPLPKGTSTADFIKGIAGRGHGRYVSPGPLSRSR